MKTIYKKILFVIFIFFAYLNYRYLELGFLQNYSPDEYAFHGSFLNMYEGVMSLDIKKFLHLISTVMDSVFLNLPYCNFSFYSDGKLGDGNLYTKINCFFFCNQFHLFNF